MLSCDDGLEDNIVDSRPEQVHIDANLFKMLTEGAKTPLEAEVVLFRILILNEILVLLVN